MGLLDLDTWQEIWATVRMNRLRTALTALGVFWGMLMLLFMLGSGNGLERGVTRNMTDFATNAVYVWGQRTTMPYNGLPPGREVEYTNEDIEALQHQVAGIEYLAPRVQLGGWRDGNNVTRGTKTGNFQVMGDFPAFERIQPVRFAGGRFIDPLDIAERRKVAVIGNGVADVLFAPGEDPIGQHIKIRGVYFEIIGLFRPRKGGDEGDRAGNMIHIPFTTFQQAFNSNNKVGWFAITGHADVSAASLEQKVREVLARRHDIDPEDRQAIGSFNAEKEFRKITTLFGGIRLFIWFVGLLTLFAGAVGVSNIMLIAVKERTKEIGVRKALGATPRSIVGLVLQESIVLTSLAGYLGLVAGVLVLEVLGRLVGPDSSIFANPQVDIRVALLGTGVLVIAGAFAGIIPARHASRIHPVEALRAE
ncbi:MAG TPA: ABC transporter permease [Kofleriaceae bacterium]|nr:ABC transporter permease [Kofleriaceae bacterium]